MNYIYIYIYICSFCGVFVFIAEFFLSKVSDILFQELFVDDTNVFLNSKIQYVN